MPNEDTLDFELLRSMKMEYVDKTICKYAYASWLKKQIGFIVFYKSNEDIGISYFTGIKFWFLGDLYTIGKHYNYRVMVKNNA